MFVFQTGVQRNLDLHGLEVEDANIGAAGSFSLGNRTSKFDLSLTLVPVAEGLDGVLEYDIDLFEHDTIERIGDAFLALLGAALNDSTTPLYRLPVMGDEEQRRIVRDWNDTHRTRSDESVVSRFEFIAEQRANTGALRCGGREVSYAVLQDDVNRVAGCLLEAGVRSGDRVGVCIEPSTQLTASLLGVLRCGALFVPLEPDLPTARLRALTEDACISRVLVDDTTAGLFDSLPVECIDANASPVGNVALPDIELRGADPAYVLFTSGSTGRPKGVVGTHGGLLNRIDWIREEYPYRKDEWCCHRTNLGFVDAIAEMFAPLLCGVPAVVFTRKERSTPATLTDALARHGITRLTLAPVLLRALLHQQGGIKRLKSLKYCICSGEVLPASLWERFHEQLPDATLLNLYGSTEVAADATWFDCRNAAPGRPIPIGKPIHNTRVYVVDDFMRPQPIGVAGRLLVSGIGLAKGYWNSPGLTAERFLPDPFNEGETSYVTGDLARFLPGGNLEYIGRADNQIKLHGIRIEPVEIEAVLARHPAVQSAVVALCDHPERGQRLAAWIVYAVGERPGVTALRAYLGEHLPRQWIPSLYVELQQLPLLPSGKVDRQALPPPDDSRPDVASAYEGPSTPAEKRLAAIWKRILGISRIGRTDDFFDLGGHSILAFALLQAIQEEFGAELPLSHVFLHPTVSRLAAQIEKRPAPKTRTPVVIPVRNRGESSPFFCVPAAAQSVYSIRGLASEFRDDQSFFAVQPLGFDGAAAPQDSVPQMVSTYVQALRERQPGGPYYLGGRCFGGVVAAEVARQLQEEGETIGLLVLLDTNVPNPRRLRYLLKQSDVASRPGLLIRWPFELVLARANRRRLAIETGQQLENLSETLAGRMREIDEAHRKANRAYELTPITAPVVWIRAGVPWRGLRFGWAPFARGDFSCIDAVGDHFSMFEPPHVENLSRTLSEVLAGRRRSRVNSVASRYWPLGR
jgi:amino acid adenylation domain-containing protein